MAVSINPNYIIIGASGDIGTTLVNRLKGKSKLFLSHSPNNYKYQSQSANNLTWYSVDVTQSDSVNAFITKIENEIEGPIKLVYCAGILDDHPIAKITDQSWEKVLNVNLTGAFYVIRSIFRLAAVRGKGRIILIGSIASNKPSIGQAAYSASKSGLEALCKVAAIELGRFNCTCNVVAPGAIESSMVRDIRPVVIQNMIKNTPLRKLGNTTDVASLVEFLLSDESLHITGQVINVDGGLTSI